MFKNKSSAISIGASILFFAVLGFGNFPTNNYFSTEHFAKALTPAPILIYETFLDEKNSAEENPDEKILEKEKDLEEGLILYFQGKYQESINFYTEYLEKNPDNEVAYNRRANVYFLKLEQYDAAIADYTRALEINPEYWKAYYNRGNVYGILKQYETAILDYNKAISLKPHFADARENRGICYLHLGKIEKALADFAKATVFGF